MNEWEYTPVDVVQQVQRNEERERKDIGKIGNLGKIVSEDIFWAVFLRMLLSYFPCY